MKDLATNQSGIIATTFGDKVQLYQRDGMTLLNEFDEAPFGDNYGLEFSSDVNNRLIQIGKTEIHSYDLDGNGNSLNHNFQLNPYQTSWENQDLVISPSGKYIANNSKEIFDSNLIPI